MQSHTFVPLFPGQGSSSAALSLALNQALRDSRSPSAQLLLASCHEAFHLELSKLSENELNQSCISLLDFQEATSLLSPSSVYQNNPIISSTSLFLVQALRYLAHCSAEPNSRGPFPDHRLGVLGYSSGIVTACVVGASNSVLTFVSNAVEAFRLAFWIGLRSIQHKTKELQSALVFPDTTLPWTVVCIGLNRSDVLGFISDFETKHDCIASLHLTAILDTQHVTISGRPDILQRFSSSIAISKSCIIHPTTTDALYHAHTLRSVRAQVLADVGNHLIRFPDFSDLKYPVFSTISGKPVTQGSEHSSLVDAVLDMIIASPVDWMSVVQGLGSAAPSDAPTQVLNFGPSSGLLRMLEKSLSADKIICRDVTVCDSSSPDAATGHTFKQEPIAIVGMALRLPGGARNANELWELLERGINTISEIPADRFQLERYTSADAKSGRGMKVHTGNFIDRPDEFDYKFFKVSPREAKSMDPQQRILLHTAHDALENAGYVPDATPSFQRDTFGCFIGTATHDYADNLREDIDVHYSTGTLKAFLSGRISYAMQLGGPSMTLDTACSSSIVALHQACRALVNGDCNAAIAGGVNVMSSPDMFIGLDHGHFLSPTGQCKSFDASADGYSRSEGCSLFVLKRLSDAVAENDDILGVIRGIDINQSGLAHSITHPHIPSQVALMNRLLKNAGVDASRVSVVEAHGTGTQAGDFSELQSIRAVLCRARDVSNPLHVTSIKANIGHLEAASGAAGLAKLLLMFQHDTIPAQISLKTLNPRITPLAQDNTVIDTLPSPWVRGSSPRMALLNNFGASGSNGALIVEEYTRQAKAPASGASYVFGISAKTREVLETLRVSYFKWLHDGRNRSVPMSDIAYTATARRQLYPYRISVDVVSKEQLVQGLASAEMTHCEGNFGQVVFVFSGQGSYYRGMGKLLYSSSPVFQRCIDRCHRYLVSKGFADILPSIIGGAMDSADGMEEFEASQTATFALEVALATLWIHWGLTPAVVVGHSLGEYAALVIAEVISLEAALFLVASRARLTWRSCASGTTGMLAIRLGEQQIKPILKNTSYADLSVACVNSDRACVVSGPLSQLEVLTGELAATGSKARLLDVPYGYHSQAMDPVLDDLTQLARTVPLGCPKVAVGSTVLGRLVPVGDSATFDATYFATHFRQPVLFAPTVDALCKHPSLPQIDAWIEMGPQASCLLMIKACASAPSEAALLPSLSKNDNGTLASSLSQLYRTSAPLNWRNVFEEVAPGTCADLPPYPLETHKIWVPYKEPFLPSLESLKSKVPALAPASPPARRTAPAPARTTAPPAPARATAPPQIVTQANLISDYPFLRAWVQYPSRENGNAASFDTPIEVLAPYIQGHKVAEHCLCPASIYLEQVLSGADLSRRHLGFDFGKSMAVLRGVHFAKPLVYHPQVNRVVRTHVTIHEDGTGFFTITSRLQSSLDESVHVRGEIRFQSIRETTASLDSEFRLIPRLSAEEIGSRKEGQAEIFSTRTLYEVVFPRVVEYSAKYHTIQTLTASADGMDGIAQVKLPSDGPRLSFAAHPIFTDTLLHTAGFLANMQGDVSDAYICSEIESFKMLSEYIDQDQSYTVHCRGSWMSFDNIVLTEAYAVQDQEPRRVVALMKGIQFKRVRLSGLARGLATAADSASAQTRTRTDSNAITPHATPQGIIFGRSRSSTESTGGVQISNSGNSSRPSSPETLVSDDDRRIRIRDIIAQVLGLATLDIEDHSDFKSLGLDSLSSLEALHALKTELGVDLPHDAFETYSTIISLNAFLDKSSGSSLQKIVERSPQKSLERSHASPARSVASTVTVSGDDRRIRIRGIIAEVLGLSISDVEDDSDFKSLGLDSLSSLEALHALKTELGVDLPHDAFESHSTIASLNASLDKSSSPQKSVERAPQKPVERSHSSPAKSVALTVTVSDDDRLIRIRGIIAEVLGLPISDVEDDADFKSLGLDSLSSLEALHAFKTELSVDLPHDAFESYSTIASLNASLNKSSSPKKSSGRSGPSTKTLQPASFDTRMSRLQFSKDDIAVPLLLIHDGSGLINHYNRVMPLHRDVFALSNPCLITGGKWESVEQMAESYANVVLGAKSDQIIIGGWSFGGVVAFETAKRLVQHGVRVHGIVLIDSPCPGKHVPLSSSVIDHVTKAHSKGIDSGTLNLVAEQFKESSRLLSVYNPSREGKLEVPVVLLRSSEGYAPPGLTVPDWLQHRGSEGAVVSEWEAFTRSPVKTWSIPGDHFGPFNPENIEQTSQQLKDACHYVERL
ncbi:polyketide synthase [Suillus clintonianus]|uniref:polyketide synthase n=1 Tax=Suillus clintonianus TaxID=1904413 RepID=UPI001B8764EB|nr:polyketide synthase [Suillus clintonianus]KAG2123824.1 polyketide synthase [Suillus clintonianus]